MRGFQNFTSEQALVNELLKFGETEVSGNKPFRKYVTTQSIVLNQNLTKLLYTEISFVSNVRLLEAYETAWSDVVRWKKAMEEFNLATKVPGVKRGVVTNFSSWSWNVTQKALVDNMYLGIGVVLAVSLISLAISTGNIVIAVLALTSIAGILTNVMALVYIYGWALGITESIGVVIAIGFSFDYIAHIGNAYCDSERSLDRKERTRSALTELGISVVAGAFSTLLAGSMLLFVSTFFANDQGKAN